jgi:flagellar basal-body rod protein FlgC
MNAESMRLNLSASNVANKNNISGTDEGAYRALKPIFQLSADGGVDVKEIVKSDRAVQILHQPNHPLANADGNVFSSNVGDEEEMADIISASKNYELNAEVLSSIKQLMIKTIQL